MNRRLVGCALALGCLLPLAACSGTADPATAHPSISATAAPVNQSAADACISITEQLGQATAAMKKAITEADDPQVAVDAWATIGETFDSLTAKVGNAEVKSGLAQSREKIQGVHDVLQSVVEGDTAAKAKFAGAMKDMQESLSALVDTCKG